MATSFSKRPGWAIIVGGIFFLLPLLAAIVLVTRGIKLILPIGEKVTHFLKMETLFGAASVSIVSVLLLLIVCYLSGLMLSRGMIKRWSASVEEKLFLLFPNFQMVKYQLLKDADKFIDRHWDAVLLEEDNSFRIAFITDQTSKEVLVLYVPDAPRMDAGEIRYMHADNCKYHPIPMKIAMNAIGHFGREEDLINIIKEIKTKA